jgi:S-adenosylmethionine/arginine decarboxylase-like enzyme
MKKSELKKYVRENIISELSESTEDEINKTKELTQAVQDLESAKKEAGIEEANIGLADLEEMGYEIGEKAFDMHFDKSILKNRPDTKSYVKGFVQAIIDSAGSLSLDEKVAKTVDDVIDPADYGDIGKGYLDGFNKPNSLDADQLETLGRKIVKQLYKGDFDKAKAKFIKENLREDEDAEPTKSDIKKTKGLAKAKEELALLTREMKSLAKKYSKAKGEEKEKLVKILKDKTKLKKELENILDKKKI